MSATTISLGTTAGERITIALVVLTLCVEVLSDNACREPQAVPMTLYDCQVACWDDGERRPGIKRWESFACECAVSGGEE